jgi:hypothetical protein
MLTYEHFVAVLLSSIERSSLNVAYTQELLDTHALGRSLTITCIPEGEEDDSGPQEPPLRATISFRWSPEFTIFSLRGGESLGDIEHMVDERLTQAHSGPSLDIDINYTIPITIEQSHDLGSITQVAQTVQDFHGAFGGTPETAMRLEAVVTVLPGRPARIGAVAARQTWSVDEALYDHELLSDTFDELCDELHDMLEALSIRFTAQNERRPSEDGGDRRYLKPPTA